MAGKAQPARHIRGKAEVKAGCRNGRGDGSGHPLGSGTGAADIDLIEQHASKEIGTIGQQRIDLRKGQRRIFYGRGGGSSGEKQELPPPAQRRDPGHQDHRDADDHEDDLNLAAHGQQGEADKCDYAAAGDDAQERGRREIAGNKHQRDAGQNGE